MHSTNSRKNNRERRGRTDNRETVDAILDRGVDVDGFRRVSLLGLEILTIDGPTRVRRAEPKPDEPR